MFLSFGKFERVAQAVNEITTDYSIRYIKNTNQGDRACNQDVM